MKKLLTSLFLFATVIAVAQDKGTIQGKVLDKEMNNESLPFANVFVKGTQSGTTTDMDGVYMFKADPGTYTLVVSFVGYETVEVPNVVVKAGEVTTLDNIILGPNQGVALKEVVIKATTQKESVAALLTDQKKAVEIKTSIGAQELSRKGIGDVATAVTKVTGISKQEGGGSVFVRGLGDRYNVTTLNGLPLPSNNPSKKNIDLGLFSTDIVEFIGIDKTYSVRNYGDFAGANIDIVSKNYRGKGFLEIGLESGINTEAFGVDTFYLNEGPNKTGFYNIDYPNNPLGGYNFTTSWDRQKASTPLNGGFSIKGGDSFEVGEESRLNIFGVASFSNGYSYREGVSRGGVNFKAVPDSDFDFFNYGYSTNATAMGNAVLKSGKSTFNYNILYLNSTGQNQKEYYGIIDKDDDAQEGGGFIQRAVFDRTSLIINQLLGKHKMNDKWGLDWGVSYNILDNIVPNRRQNTVLPVVSSNPDGPRSMQAISSAGDNHRYYHNLKENEAAANISATINFKQNEDEEYDGKLTVGYSGRFKKVDFDATQFNFRIERRDNNNNFITQPVISNIYDLDAYFNQNNLNAGYFTIETFRKGTTNPLKPQTYNGNQFINAVYGSVEYKFNPKFTLLAGLRGEQINQNINFDTSLKVGKSDLSKFEILPSLSLKYELNDKQNLKFATSKTYTLPQYKERALFLFQEVNQDYQGNPALYSSTDYNFDLIWELFPKSGELISAGVFGKLIQNPINQTVINSASNDISWVNSGDQATAFGAELELRKKLLNSEREVGENTLINSLSAGFNLSYMVTNQDLDNDKVLKETAEAGFPISTDFTKDSDRISGASDLLVNADVSYSTDFSENSNLLATLSYSHFSDRIFALGVQTKGNLVEKGFGTLDFVLKSKLSKHISLGFSAKNILNPTVERFQDTQNVTVLSYKKGRDFKLSLSYKF